MKIVLALICAVVFAMPGYAQEISATITTSPTQAAAPSEPLVADTTPIEQAVPVLPLGARVQLEFVDAITSATAVDGQEIALRLAEPLEVDGAVLIPAGALATGVVIDAQANGLAGRPGLIAAAARHLDFNGERIPLEGMIAGGAGRSNERASQLMAVGGAVGGLAGAFIRGAEFEIPAGTRVSARIAGGPPEVAAPVEGINPVPSPPPGKALVVFYQLAQMGTEIYTYGAAENGVALARLRGNQYLAVEVEPGVHEFEVLAPMGGRRTGVTLSQEIFEGQIVFIRHDRAFLSPGDEESFLRRRLRVAPIPPTE